MKLAIKLFTASLVIVNVIASTQQAQARRFFAAGANGTATGYANQGTYGSRAGARFLGATQGGGASAGQWAGPNGGTGSAANAFGYKQGVGAFRQGGWKASGPNGAGAGSTNSTYNAQTGQGARTSSQQYTPTNGEAVGYNGNTTYTKGQGGQSVVQTDQHGTYDVNYAPGQRPVVTSVPPPTSN